MAVAEKTSRMVVFDPTGSYEVVFNGNVEERAHVKALFDQLMATNLYMAYVTEAPGKAKQITTFPKGTTQTEIKLTPALAGGSK